MIQIVNLLMLFQLQDGNLSHEDQLYWKDVAIKNANKETKALQVKYDELNEKLEEALKEASSNKHELEKHKEKVDESEQRQSNVDSDELDKLNKVLELKDEEIEHLKVTLNTKEKKFAEFNSSTKKLRAENKKLQNLEARLETERVTAASKAEQLEEQYASLEAQCANLDSQVNLNFQLRSYTIKRVNYYYFIHSIFYINNLVHQLNWHWPLSSFSSTLIHKL